MESGIWKIVLISRNIVVGNYDMWPSSGGVLSADTKFLRPSERTTLTIPSTADSAVSMGAYDAYTDDLAFFSKRGFPRGGVAVKPEFSSSWC